MKRTILGALTGLAALAWVGAAGAQDGPREPQLFDIRVDEKLGSAPAGRLLVYAQPLSLADYGIFPKRLDPLPYMLRVEANPEEPYKSAVAASEIAGIASGEVLTVGADALAYPMPFSRLPRGDFLVQAVLDLDRNLKPSPGDFTSAVLLMRLPGPRQTLVLKDIEPFLDPWNMPPPRSRPLWAPAPTAAAIAAGDRINAERSRWREAAKARTERVSFPSPAMTEFSQRPVQIRAHVLTPPDYDQNQDRYPVAYVIRPSSWKYEYDASWVENVYEMMTLGQMPPMIWVFLDQRSPTGAHFFADSANTGPWGKALTEELIPWLEARYRTDGVASGRLVTGEREGGWSALWLQVRYPELFGGAWPLAPYPVDFHEFFNLDLHAPDANAYRQSDGTPELIMRRPNGATVTFQEFAQLEHTLGEVGGRLASFEWAFSPKGTDGKPQPLFDRETGAIDPQVAAHWRDSYDIAERIRSRWPELRSHLDGKIHMSMGATDVYYLDRAAQRLKATLDALGARSDLRLVDNGWSDIAIVGIDAFGLHKITAWEMYAVARPEVRTPPYTPTKARGVTVTPPGEGPQLPPAPDLRKTSPLAPRATEALVQ